MQNQTRKKSLLREILILPKEALSNKERAISPRKEEEKNRVKFKLQMRLFHYSRLCVIQYSRYDCEYARESV